MFRRRTFDDNQPAAAGHASIVRRANLRDSQLDFNKIVQHNTLNNWHLKTVTLLAFTIVQS